MLSSTEHQPESSSELTVTEMTDYGKGIFWHFKAIFQASFLMTLRVSVKTRQYFLKGPN
jgi:hypothetical protein